MLTSLAPISHFHRLSAWYNIFTSQGKQWYLTYFKCIWDCLEHFWIIGKFRGKLSLDFPNSLHTKSLARQDEEARPTFPKHGCAFVGQWSRSCGALLQRVELGQVKCYCRPTLHQLSWLCSWNFPFSMGVWYNKFKDLIDCSTLSHVQK